MPLNPETTSAFDDKRIAVEGDRRYARPQAQLEKRPVPHHGIAIDKRERSPVLDAVPSLQGHTPRRPLFQRQPQDHSSVQESRQLAALRQHPNSRRAGSEPRKRSAAASVPPETASSHPAPTQQDILRLKMKVPNTLATKRATPMKHQTSQSTDDEVVEQPFQRPRQEEFADRRANLWDFRV